MSSTFFERYRDECINGSGIAPELFNAAIQPVSDIKQLPGGEASYPIHEALNWRLTRFGHQARQTLEGAVFQNEDGSSWQLKLDRPKCKDKMAPTGNGSRAFLPAVPFSLQESIKIELTGLFWDWIEQHPEIPLLITEGGKKSLSLLSAGYVAIALYGVNAGYRVKNAADEPIAPELIADIARFARPGRKIIIAFDQDAQAKTRRRVHRAIAKFGALLQAAGCTVLVAFWDAQNGLCKGIDDLAAHAGPAAQAKAIDEAIALDEWQARQHITGKLTLAPSLRLHSPDLSRLQIESIPQSGIIATKSAKGTGKTKYIGSLIQERSKVVLVGHRIALTRNLCRRLNIHYRADLDKHNGNFLAPDGYTEKIGTVADSLLAIDAEKFRGCDLVIDEVCQVLRHLTDSSTCNKDGKRPVLLARLTELLSGAARIIVADADLDDATLHYLKALSGKEIYLIQNEAQLAGYAVDFVQAPDDSYTITKLLTDAAAGLRLFVSTDSKAKSKDIAAQLNKLGISNLLINSETSGGEVERAFITDPDNNLDEIQVVIASPSMATGISIERPYFNKVYGLFYGFSGTDPDMAQALGRVRQNVARVVWCAEKGRNYCAVSRSTVPFAIKAALKDRTDTTAALIRCNLRVEPAGLGAYDWQSDPHLNLWSAIAADQNRSMGTLRTALKARLRLEGNSINIINAASDKMTKILLKLTRQEVKAQATVMLLEAEVLNPETAKRLADSESIEPKQQLALERFYFCDFYAIAPDELTLELIEFDNEGRTRSQIYNLENQLYAGLAIDADAKSIHKQTYWGKGLTPWDTGSAEIKRKMREMLGLDKFLDCNRSWTKYDLDEFAEKCETYTPHIKAALNITYQLDQSITQFLGVLLRQIGLKTEFSWSRQVEGYEGQKLRVYRLDRDHWQKCRDILDRREVRRTASGSQPPLITNLEAAIQDKIKPEPPNKDRPAALPQLGSVILYVVDGSRCRVRSVQNGAVWLERLDELVQTVGFAAALHQVRAMA